MRTGEQTGNPRESYGAPPGEGRPSRRAKGLTVYVDDRGVEAAMRVFKRLILKEGLLKDLKRHAHYEKPGDRKRRKTREAIRRRRRQALRSRRFGEPNE